MFGEIFDEVPEIQEFTDKCWAELHTVIDGIIDYISELSNLNNKCDSSYISESEPELESLVKIYEEHNIRYKELRKQYLGANRKFQEFMYNKSAYMIDYI